MEYTPVVECDDVQDVHELPLVLVDSLHLEMDCRVTGTVVIHCRHMAEYSAGLLSYDSILKSEANKNSI